MNTSNCVEPLTNTAIYDAEQGLIWGYGEDLDSAWSDAAGVYLDEGFAGRPEDECEVIACTKALAESGLGGRGDFALLIDERGSVVGACLPREIRTSDAWWAWYWEDSSRASEDHREAELRCCVWMSGRSNDGPSD